MKINKLISMGLATLVAVPLLAQSPWLPVPKTMTLTVDRVSEDADEFYRGDERVGLPFNFFEQQTTWFGLNWGLTDKVAMDGRIGIANYETGGLEPTTDTTDITFGITRSLRDEFETGGYSISVRGALHVAGSYPSGMGPFTIGDGANAFELGLNWGKFVTDQFAIASGVKMKFNEGEVPTETTLSGGANLQVTPTIGVYGILENQLSGGDLDIAGPGFNPSRFPETKEQFFKYRVGTTINHPRGTLDVSYAQVLSGSNVTAFDTLSIAFSLKRDLFRR